MLRDLGGEVVIVLSAFLDRGAVGNMGENLDVYGPSVHVCDSSRAHIFQFGDGRGRESFVVLAGADPERVSSEVLFEGDEGVHRELVIVGK